MFLYRLLLTLCMPVLAWRLWREGPAQRAQRFGQTENAAPVWVHGASNGELTAAKPLIDALLDSDPKLRLLITCNTVTACAMVQSWALERAHVQLAPLDLRWVLKRFLRAVNPRLLIVIENELWPNRMAMMQARGGAVAVVSARMSEKSATNWARLPGLASQVMGLIDMFCAQDAASQARFAALGVDKSAIGPIVNLKSRTAPGAFDKALFDAYAQILPRDSTVLAASTHPGEEAIVLDAFKTALEFRPDLRLILAPRHPKRADAVAQLIRERALSFTRRSQTEPPGKQVFLADTLGEMALWYELSSLCFVGGSLVPKGGHTPFEPIAHGCVVLHGPYLENYAEPYAALDAAGAVTRVASAKDLTQSLLSLDTGARHHMAAQAREVAGELHAPDRLKPIAAKLLKL